MKHMVYPKTRIPELFLFHYDESCDVEKNSSICLVIFVFLQFFHSENLLSSEVRETDGQIFALLLLRMEYFQLCQRNFSNFPQTSDNGTLLLSYTSTTMWFYFHIDSDTCEISDFIILGSNV